MLTWLGDSVESKEASELMEEGETGSVFVWTPVGGRVRQQLAISQTLKEKKVKMGKRGQGHFPWHPQRKLLWP